MRGPLVSDDLTALRGDSPGCAGGIYLSVRYHPAAVVIKVRDLDPSPPVPAGAGPDAESGRGLVLVHALSKEWGHYPLPSGGKVVYCVISTERVG